MRLFPLNTPFYSGGTMSNKKTLLLVEDEALIRLALSRDLSKEGYRVIEAGSGRDAVRVAKSNTDIDLVLMDMKLGKGMDGTEAARLILADRDIPIVFLSNHTEKEIVGKTDTIASYGYVIKSSDITVLDASIRMAFRLADAHRQVKEGADRFRALTRTSADGFWMVDLKGKLLDVNEAYCTMTGYSKDELLTMAVRDLEIDEDAPAVESHIQKIARFGLNRFETRHRRKDGSIIDVEVNATYSSDQGQVLAFIRDITDRKRTEEALRESERRYRLISENAADVIWAMDPLSGRFTYVSPSIMKLRGYTPEEAMNQTFTEVLTPESAKTVTEKLTERLPLLLSQGTGTASFVDDVDQPRKDGSIVHTEVTTTFIRDEEGRPEVIGVTRDATERRKAAKMLAESEKQYRLLFATNPNPMLVFDEETLRFLAVNDVAVRHYGWTEEEFLTMTVLDIRPPEDREEALKTIRDSQGALGTFVGLHRHWKNNGTVIFVEITVSSVSFGSRAARLCSINDVTEQRRAQEALERSEARYRSLFDQMTEGFALHEIICDESGRPSDYRFLEINPAFERLTGLDRQGLLGRTVREVIPGTESSWIERYGQVALTGEPAHIEDFSAALGKYYEVFAYSPAFSQFAVMFTDITSRKEAEIALRESETRWATTLASIGDAVIATDREGRITFMNAIAEEATGWPLSDASMKPLSDVFTIVNENTRASVENPVEKVIREGTVVGLANHTILVRRDGTEVPIDDSGAPIRDSSGQVLGVVLVFRDITERKRTEATLAESQAHVLSIMNSTEDMIWSIDAHSYGLLAFNRTFANYCQSLIGVEPRIGMVPEELVPPESAGEWRALYSRALDEGSFSAEAPKPAGHSTTFSRTLLLSLNVLKRGGEAFGISVFAKDITERNKLEDQLRQAQKMEAVGTLAGGVAHDFNNLLTVILGFAQLIQMSTGKEDRVRPYVDQIVTSSNRAAELTQSLLAFSRKQRINPEPHDINEVIASSAKLLRRLLPEDIQLTLDLTDRNAIARVDITQINQVIMNLATNARDAMPRGGFLTIVTRQAKIDQNFHRHHGFGRGGDYVKLSVSDTGIGMDKETLEHIFEPFFTTKEVGKGTGLGLASTFGIVKQHSGYIAVSSVPFKGTTFDIYLPLLDAPASEQAAASRDLKGGTENILVVEDDPAVRNMLIRILENSGYTVIEAVDGYDAIRTYHDHGKSIDLIILDVVMPGKNGKEVLDEISQSTPNAKAIFVSGYTGDVVIDKGLSQETVDFLQKPLSVSALLAKVREVLDR
jgi:two-component system, cell cycle sensor histidine kinase and response regulator CckA